MRVGYAPGPRARLPSYGPTQFGGIVNCPSCQTDNPNAAKFCFNCGFRLDTAAPVAAAPAPTCRECQATLPVDAHFCGFCGTRDPIAEVVVTPAPSPAPAPSVAPAPSSAPAVTRDPIALAYDDDDDHDDEFETGVLGAAVPNAAAAPNPAPTPVAAPPQTHDPRATPGTPRPLNPRPRTGEVEPSPGAYVKHGPSLRARRTTGSTPAVVEAAPSEEGPDARPPMGGRLRGGRTKPRPVTQPQQAVFASPRPEMAAILAPPTGWPDITDELAEIRFSTIQGFDDDSRRAVEDLCRRYPGHPEALALAQEMQGASEPEPSFESDALASAVDLVRGKTVIPDEPPNATAPMPVVSQPLAAEPEPEPEPIPAVDEPLPRRTMLPDSADGRDPPVVAVDDDADRFAIPQAVDDDLLLSAEDDDIATTTFDSIEEEDEDELDPGIPSLDRPEPGHGVAPEVEELHSEQFEVMEDSTVTPLESLEVELLDPEEVEEVDDDLGDDLEDDEPSFLNTTMAVHGYQPPAPYTGALSKLKRSREPEPEPEPNLELEPEPELEPDLGGAGDGPSVRVGFDDRQAATLAPGGDLREADELQTTLAPVGRRATLGPQHEPDYDENAAVRRESAPQRGMTAPDRAGDEAAASGEFRVDDLDLDLDDVIEYDEADPEFRPTDGVTEAVAESDSGSLTVEGTVVARAPLPPAPYGQAAADLPVVPATVVMLGTRGEPVAECRVEVGTHLDIGREPGRPWAEDSRMAPLHARLFPAPGGIVVDDLGVRSGVYTQISDTIAVQDGDEFKVGQARLTLRRSTVPGAWGELIIISHDDPTPRIFPLEQQVVQIGRDEGDITMPTDTFVSGDHCRFACEGNAIYLEDLGSSNGTYVRVRAGQCVAFGGLLLVGHTQFRVHLG